MEGFKPWYQEWHERKGKLIKFLGPRFWEIYAEKFRDPQANLLTGIVNLYPEEIVLVLSVEELRHGVQHDEQYFKIRILKNEAIYIMELEENDHKYFGVVETGPDA